MLKPGPPSQTQKITLHAVKLSGQRGSAATIFIPGNYVAQTTIR